METFAGGANKIENQIFEFCVKGMIMDQLFQLCKILIEEKNTMIPFVRDISRVFDIVRQSGRMFLAGLKTSDDDLDLSRTMS